MNNKQLREFQIFAKPAGPFCNLGCSYCYYLDKKSLYPEENSFIMPDETLELYIRQHIEASTGNIISFSWHGGEPLLAGIDFFKKALKLQKKYKPSEKTILNGIQTNGTLINDEWCRFFREEGFVLGMSIDGPGILHDTCRIKRDGKPTWHNVYKGYSLLKRYGIVPEILCVVHAGNVKYPLEIYNLFVRIGARFITFIPLVVRDNSSQGVSKDSVTSDDFGYFLSTIFDKWIEKDIGEVKVQIFEEAARSAFGQEHTLCIFRRECGGVPVVEHNGDFYCCDQYVEKDHCLGNIRDNDISFYLDSDKQNEFGKKKNSGLTGQCLACEVLSMCNGECPRNRFIKTSDGEEGLNYLCSGYRYFFNHCRPFVEAIAEAWKEQNNI